MRSAEICAEARADLLVWAYAGKSVATIMKARIKALKMPREIVEILDA